MYWVHNLSYGNNLQNKSTADIVFLIVFITVACFENFTIINEIFIYFKLYKVADSHFIINK